MLKVVIVEDEYMAQTGLGHLIEKINPEYHIAGYADNGCDGMVLVKEVKPDIVITDIKMPRMNGLEMIESLRKIHMDCAEDQRFDGAAGEKTEACLPGDKKGGGDLFSSCHKGDRIYT